MQYRSLQSVHVTKCSCYKVFMLQSVHVTKPQVIALHIHSKRYSYNNTKSLISIELLSVHIYTSLFCEHTMHLHNKLDFTEQLISRIAINNTCTTKVHTCNTGYGSSIGIVASSSCSCADSFNGRLSSVEFPF